MYLKIRVSKVSFAHWKAAREALNLSREPTTMCSVMLQHMAPGPSCSPSHVSLAPFPQWGNAPAAWHIRCAHDGRNASGGERVGAFPGHLAGSDSKRGDYSAGSFILLFYIFFKCFWEKHSTEATDNDRPSAGRLWYFHFPQVSKLKNGICLLK